MRDKLKAAIKQKDMATLKAVIEECEIAAYPELGKDLRKARDALESLGGGRGG